MRFVRLPSTYACMAALRSKIRSPSIGRDGAAKAVSDSNGLGSSRSSTLAHAPSSQGSSINATRRMASPRRHADRAVETDRFAVQHVVGDDLVHELRVV